jgi:hypothetical protein
VTALNSNVRPLVEFLDAQRTRQAAHFATVKYPKVLSFMGTTSQPGTHATVAILPITRLEPGASPSEMRVHLRGRLPREVARGECVTVHVDKIPQYQGYQIKTRPLTASVTVDQLLHSQGDDLIVEGRQIYTVHHSPLVGMGETANISPRFIFHSETKLERLVLFHGDGLALKTYMNLKQNRQETRIVVDLDTFEGYAIEGTVEEFAPHQHPEAYDRICQGFAAGNWGRPSRVFRFVCDRWTPLAPFKG